MVSHFQSVVDTFVGVAGSGISPLRASCASACCSDHTRFTIGSGGTDPGGPSSVVVVALTSRSAKPVSFRPEVDVAGDQTRVLVEQLGAVDVRRLGRSVGRLTADEMWSVDDALHVVLGLD